jgi:diacylglycerol kinase family enzyme/membrane-associated phospholipid phosphatase
VRIARLPVIPRSRGVVAALVRRDCQLFVAVSRARTPWLDRALPLLSMAANHSALWIGVAGGLWVGGGRRGQRAAVRGLGSIAVTSLVVNQGIKRVVRRPRPSVRNVPAVRRVKVPALTTSFPSGHAGSAAAFASGVASELAPVGAPLALLAAAVGVSRVYVGVHYPLDVLVGAGIGAGVGQLTRRVWPVLPERADDVPPSSDRRRVEPNDDGRGVAVVVNPGSGSALDEDFVASLRSRLPRARIVELDDDADLEAALRAAANDCEVLGIVGGDGSVNAAAQLALERERRLLLLPGGTLNHLARDLRVESADDAIDALVSGEIVGIDVATIDGRPFLNMAGFGAYPEMLANSARLKPWLGRWVAHAAACVTALIDADPLEVSLDGTRRSIWLGSVGNCCHEPDGLAPSWRPRLDDERLDVRLVLADPPLSRFRALIASLTGRLPRSRTYRRCLARELRVESSHSQIRLAQDGEYFDGHGSFGIEKLPRRLLVHARHRPANI